MLRHRKLRDESSAGVARIAREEHARKLDGREGPYTYDGIALADAHAVAQVVQGVDVRLAAFAHGYVFDIESLVAPRAQRFDVEVFVLGRHVERGGAVVEGEPALAGRKILQRHLQRPGGARKARGRCLRAHTGRNGMRWECAGEGESESEAVESTVGSVCAWAAAGKAEGAIRFGCPGGSLHDRLVICGHGWCGITELKSCLVHQREGWWGS